MCSSDLKDQLIANAGQDVDLVISGAEIAQTLGQIADQTNLELFGRLGWSEPSRSEERRVGKECRSRWSPYH